MTDADLIRRFIERGDEQAFRQLYASHSPAVYGLLRRLTGPARDLADDVLQDTWLRAAARLGRFRGESAFRTWLTGIALNCLRERRRQSSAPAVDAETIAAPTTSPGRALDVADVLDTLPAHYRDVLVLHDVEGYTHEEIATALDIEIGTSKSRLARARQHFRARWRATPGEVGAQP